MYKHRHGLTHTRDVIKMAAVCDGRSGKPVSLIVIHEKKGFKVDVDVTECIVYVQGHDHLTFSFLSSVLFFFWVGVLWPQLSKVLKLVRWASSVSFPPVSLQRQVVCLLLRPVFMECSSQGIDCR